MRIAIASVVALALMPMTAVAAGDKKDAKDPNRIICEKQEVVGSRLATKRICMTAAQWEERRREDRQALEKAQNNVKTVSGN